MNLKPINNVPYLSLEPIASNMTEVTIKGGLTILFSYATPVACMWENGQGAKDVFITEKKWSATTTRHINKWIDLKSQEKSFLFNKRPQEFFDNLLNEVK